MGHCVPIKVTRALLAAAMNGTLDNVAHRIDAHCETCANKEAYDAWARKLVSMFVKNVDTFKDHVGSDVMDASPQMTMATEQEVLLSFLFSQFCHPDERRGPRL